jgi:predicted RNA-binding Zn ribbon-like protein
MAIAKDFGFVGRLCLDFAQTGDMGWGAAYERLTSPAQLRRWFALSPLRLASLRVTPVHLAHALRLRHAIWSLSQAILQRERAPAAEVRRLNAHARRPPLRRELASPGTLVRWYRPNVAAALSTIAADAVSLFGDPKERGRLRRCENPDCRVVFFDDSRPASRRWCLPNRCGDRIRAREYRLRHG